MCPNKEDRTFIEHNYDIFLINLKSCGDIMIKINIFIIFIFKDLINFGHF